MFKKIFIWALRFVVAIILLQTLYFKFTGAPESVYIFETLGIEPYGRIGSGIAELITSILILIPRTTLLGAILGLGIMIGAILSHLTKLGIEVNNDGGTLFTMAIIVFISCVVLIYVNKDKIPALLKFKI
ncbi:DoxX family protein [uncultured Flavobacterium sp.]|uniref:DoxX family protein n=1 Tax=uncultured Flavobacterium sp. TaxID=165435 RepID=UPI0030EC8AB4|tara:strand:- start:65345 stop:65734 length:390 start_codon:yes stop_codon:yes gene_type:complete